MEPERQTVLVTGACGLLGAHLVALLGRSFRVVGVDRHTWWGDVPATILQGDLAESAFRSACLAEVAPDVLIHCAAMVNVDTCEQRPLEAYAANSELTRALARAVPAGCLLAYITTDGIFKGDRAFATEADLPCPRTVYGRAKLQGEWEVQLATANHLIIRTNFYGWSSGRKQTSAEWLYNALASRAPLTAFDDFFFTPIYVVDFVERLEILLRQEHRGLFHLCGRDRVSKYDFVMRMASAASLPPDHVSRGSIDEAHLVAPRPKDMSLSSERFCRVIGVDVPGCEDGLRRFLADRDRPLSARTAAPETPAAAWVAGGVAPGDRSGPSRP